MKTQAHPPSTAAWPWWRRPVRMLRIDYFADFSEFLTADLDQLAREAKEKWRANCQWVLGTLGTEGLGYVTTFDSPHFDKAPALGKRDVVREYVPIAHRHGLKVLAYLNLHWYAYKFADKHPDWEQVLADGTPYGRKEPLYGDGTTFCVNSPWRDWSFLLIRECMRAGLDGCALDGPVFYSGACYCRYCRDLFRKTTGSRRMPKFMDWEDPLWKPFAEFRCDSWARWMKDAKAAACAVNPDAVMFLNGSVFDSANINHAYDTVRLEDHQSFACAEEFLHCSDRYISPYRALNLARFLSAGKQPGIVATHHMLSTWHYAPLATTELATALAQTNAGGAQNWYAFVNKAVQIDEREALAPLETTGEFLVQTEDYVTADKPAAETGVFISNHTLWYYITRHIGLCRSGGGGKEAGLVIDQGGPQLGGTTQERRNVSAFIMDHEYPGCLDLCNFGHVPARVLWDNHLTPEKLAKLKVLILPNAACLTDAQVQAVEQYVRAGGNLFATFESGMYDEWGDPVARQRWLRFLGIDRIKGVFVPSRNDEYLTPAVPLDDIRPGVLVPRPVNGLAVKPTQDAQVLAWFLKPTGKTYSPPREPSEYPAALQVTRGKGRVVYCPATLFESFNRFHLDNYLAFGRALIRRAAGRAGLQVETNAPGSLAIEVREQPNRIIVHLVNVTADMKRPMGRIIPLRDVTLSVRAGRVTSARCLRSGDRLRLQKIGGHVRFRVPVVTDYEMVVLVS